MEPYKKIYLQWWAEPDFVSEDITWSHDQIADKDIEYLLASEVLRIVESEAGCAFRYMGCNCRVCNNSKRLIERLQAL